MSNNEQFNDRPHQLRSNASAVRALFGMMDRRQRRSAGMLGVLMLIGMGMEMLGIGLVIPTLTLMSVSASSARPPMLDRVLTFLGDPTPASLVVGGVLILVAVTAVKSAFLAFLAWRQGELVYGFQIDLSNRLFNGYMRLPYTFHLRRNSAELIRNSMGHVGDVTVVTQQGLIVLTELVVLAGVFGLLLFVEPVGALVVMGTLGAASFAFSRLLRHRLRRWGQQRQVHEGLRIQYLQEGLGGVKDAKVLGREDGFLSRYAIHNVGSARIAQRITMVAALPRLWLELLAVVGLAALASVMIAQDRPLAGFVPTLGMFAAAAFRIMPSANRVIAGVQAVLFALPMVETVRAELKLVEDMEILPETTAITLGDTLRLDRVAYRYPGAAQDTLQDVSIEIRQGTAVGIIGGSGAGKTTLVDVMLGLLTPTSGAVRVDGVNVRDGLRSWQDRIGYVPQSIFLTDESLRKNIAFGIREDEIDEDAVWRALRAAQLEAFARDLPEGLDASVGERGVRISGGQRQRIGIARALYHDPSVLLLDEATSALDSVTETSVMDAVRKLRGSKTLVIVAHRMSTVEGCDWLFRLQAGRVVAAGTPSQLLAGAGAA